MILFLLILILSALLQIWLPWWSMLLAAGVLSCFAGKSYLHAIVCAFLACGTVWLGYALIINNTQGMLMTGRIAELLALPAVQLLYVINFAFAGITGMIGAWCGVAIKKSYSKKPALK